jgi:hypothetical protein
MVPTKVSVQTFVNGLDDERRRREATALISMMKQVTGEKSVMWGPSIIGFGSNHHKYASVSCLYIRRLDDVDVDVLRAIVERSFKEVNKRHPA